MNQVNILIKKYQNRQRKETAKIVAYHFAEFLTLCGIIILGVAIITIL
jgi:GH25 family lysozyme M1 (1,4-beta-N-acetylmuramidase)